MPIKYKSKSKIEIAYSRPTLRIFGDVLKLTAGGSGQSNEGSSTDPLKHP